MHISFFPIFCSDVINDLRLPLMRELVAKRSEGEIFPFRYLLSPPSRLRRATSLVRGRLIDYHMKCNRRKGNRQYRIKACGLCAHIVLSYFLFGCYQRPEAPSDEGAGREAV